MRVAVVLLALLAGCARAPESYPPPMQRKSLPDVEETPTGMLLEMNDPNAEVYFIRDINPALEGGRWRWTNQRPELKLYVGSTERLKLAWDVGIAGVTFATTGPITISFFVNGQPAGQLPCPKPGDYRFEQPVRPELLRANAYNIIAAQADKLWTSPEDGVKLGFTVSRAGFLR